MAFTPFKTLSGGSFPVITGEQASAAMSVGDIVYRQDAAAQWLLTASGSALNARYCQIGVTLVAASAAGDTIDVCLLTPDVVWNADTAVSGGTNGPWQVDRDGILNSTAAASTNTIARYYDASPDSSKVLVTLHAGV